MAPVAVAVVTAVVAGRLAVAEAGAEEAGAGATGVAKGGAGFGRYVYQLVDDAGDPVYYGTSNNPLRRLGEHAVDPPGPFRGMQLISNLLPQAQARALETSLIQQALSDGKLIYDGAPRSISPLTPVEIPPTILPNSSMLNPRLYGR